MRRTSHARLLLACLTLALPSAASAQHEQHGRGYKPPPPTAPVVITVEKASNGKPMASTSVIFRAVRDERSDGNLEMKTDSDGRASLELLEVGSHVTVQVLAPGYATYATDFDLTTEGKQLTIKLQRPRAQVSAYGDAGDQAAPVQPGVQEHHAVAPTSVTPPPVSPTAPLQTVPPADTPSTTPGSASPNKPGSPQ